MIACPNHPINFMMTIMIRNDEITNLKKMSRLLLSIPSSSSLKLGMMRNGISHKIFNTTPLQNNKSSVVKNNLIKILSSRDFSISYGSRNSQHVEKKHSHHEQHSQYQHHSQQQPVQNEVQQQQEVIDSFTTLRRIHLNAEMYHNFYDFHSSKGRSQHFRRILYFLLAFPTLGFLLLECCGLNDRLFHQDLAIDLKKELFRQVNEVKSQIQQYHNLQYGPNSAGYSNTTTTTPLVNEKSFIDQQIELIGKESDTGFEKLQKDILRYPLIYGIIGINLAGKCV